MNKKERLVAAIEHGTVIDHIPAAKTYQVASLLGLFDLDTPVTIGFNYPSQKVGCKGITPYKLTLDSGFRSVPPIGSETT